MFYTALVEHVEELHGGGLAEFHQVQGAEAGEEPRELFKDKLWILNIKNIKNIKIIKNIKNIKIIKMMKKI